MKVSPHYDLGTGYVQISKLPFDQALKLRDWLPHTSIIKLRSFDEDLDDCIQYSEYEYWFDFLFTAEKEFDFGI
jgi:hypothetical protein